MPEWVVEELIVPERVDAADARDFVTVIEMAAALEADAYGTDELRHSPAEDLPFWQIADHPHHLYGVRDGGELVAFGIYDYQARNDKAPQASPVGALGDISAALFGAIGRLRVSIPPEPTDWTAPLNLSVAAMSAVVKLVPKLSPSKTR